MSFLSELEDKDPRLIIGLMSGTSGDGVDAVAAEISGCGAGTAFRLAAHVAHPLPSSLQADLFELFHPGALVEDLSRANAALGEVLAEAAQAAAAAAEWDAADIDLIASHGQTVRHLPGGDPASTLQIGEPAVIAERTGVTTVADFRPADMACGGEGAPLVPLADLLLFAHPERGRIMLNIGGIANLTTLPAGASADDVVAFDLGPGNALIDGAVMHLTGGSERYDRDGERASRGVADEELVDRLMGHDFFERQPPKSTGREDFGVEFLAELVSHTELSPDDLVATLTAFTARAICEGVSRLVQPPDTMTEVWVSGGGARNVHLMSLLQNGMPELEVEPIDALGVSAEAKEALCFAVLANETVMGRPGNLPVATGARRPAILGKICPVLAKPDYHRTDDDSLEETS